MKDKRITVQQAGNYIYPDTSALGFMWAFFNRLKIAYGRFVPSVAIHTRTL